MKIFNSEKGLRFVRKKINKFERTTLFYRSSFKTLKKEMPDLVFCTNQRTSLTIAPILAAQDLDIITASFIFSWDNLPKGTLIIDPDYYFVWSDFMKQEMLEYYPHIKESQIKITGTPQFEPHFDISLHNERNVFFEKYNLDLKKKYICFSGDDVTTSPFDQYYLEDLATAVKKLNEQGENIGIIYRKCPVDFSDRHLNIVEEFKNIIVCIDPLWENMGGAWNSVMPQKEDLQLLSNTIKHSEFVVNLGSSMVFDAICHDKPCVYVNYNPDKGDKLIWNVDKVYKFIHFQSMESEDVVQWVNNKNDFIKVIQKILKNDVRLDETKDWFKKINNHPINSIDRIYEEMKECIK